MADSLHSTINTYTIPLRVCLFFTYGMSLKRWDELGILDREVLLYRKLVDKGVDVAFFTYGDKEDLTYAEQLGKIKIIPAYATGKMHKNKKIAFFASFLFAIKFRKVFFRYNILKTNQMWGAWVPLLVKWINGSRLLVRCGYEHYFTLIAEKRPAWEKCFVYLLSRLVYASADRIVLTTRHLSEFIAQTFSIATGKISVYPNLIDTELFNLDPNGKSAERRILFVGRLTKEKNLFSLILACKKADIGLDLAGDGELRAELKEFTDNIKADVCFLGTYPNKELPAIINRYPILALTSFYEGNPKALLEAMSCGRAVIGTNVDGIRQLIGDNKNGILCDTDVDSISSAILKLTDNPELRRKLGENARKYILENCSIGKILDNELGIYGGIVKSKLKLDEKNNKEICIEARYN